MMHTIQIKDSSVLKVKNSLTFVQDYKRYDLNNLPDGFVIKGDLNLSGLGLKKLPDLSKVIVQGNFDCSFNELKTLEGSPVELGMNFLCNGNRLTSLKGAPPFIWGDFQCSGNKLKTLKGAPRFVKGNFFCNGNRHLLSLTGGPKVVGGDYNCTVCHLFNLKGLPNRVGGNIWCYFNYLLSVESPKHFGGKMYVSKALNRLPLSKKYLTNERD